MRWRSEQCGATRQTHHQSGMIRQLRRSTAACDCGVAVAAAAATIKNFTPTITLRTNVTMPVRNVHCARRKFLNFISFLILAFFYLQIINPCGALTDTVSSVSSAAASFSYEDDVVAVGSSSHEPKFGERLLPLRKKISANRKYAGGGIGGSGSGGASANFTTTTTQATTTTTVKSVNSLNLNKNNYIISNMEQQQQRQQQQQQHQQQQELQQDNGRKNHQEIPELITVVPLNDLDIPQMTSRRQGKQLLHRREDVNIAEVLELTEHPSFSQQHPPANNAVPTSSASLHSAPNASISKADRLVHMSTEFFVIPTTSTSSFSNIGSSSIISSTLATKSRASVKSSRGVPVGPRSVLIVAPKSISGTPSFNTTSSSSTPTIISTHSPFGAGGLRKEPWVVPVLVLASLTMLMMAAFEIFVLFKAWRTSPSRRHLFLGQMLLLGLFACAGLGAIITAQPSLLSCGTIRFGVGVAYALVFAALLVKCVFLISLNGGVYLPAPYQGLLLLFAVLIQVAIGAQWLLTTPPEVFTLSVPLVSNNIFTSAASASAHSSATASTSSAYARVFNAAVKTPAELYTHTTSTAATGLLIPLCKTQFSELLLSLIYIIFLIVFVAVLAIKSRGIRDNYREATYIGLAIGGAIPIWLGWMLCGLAVAERHKDACIAFGLVATSATVFLVMFMPKGRQLAAMGKEGLYVEDREEQFSSLSRAGSGYSPSFFHFKPIKYGVMGGMQNSTSNTGNATSMKHCSNGHSGGDRVALVTAAPPSYTRMYHYFPAHLTHPFCFYPQPPPPPLPPLPTQMTQLQMKPPPLPIPPPTLKQLGNSITSMTQAQIAQTLRYPGLFVRPDETNLYTTLEPTLSSNPNVYFQRGGAVHPGMMY